MGASVGPAAFAWLLASPLVAQTYQVLHSFGPVAFDPEAALVADASGNLYGTTAFGGSSDSGTVFRLDATNNYTLTTLHEFNGTDGAHPYAALIIDASGNIYGTTPWGGAFDYGTVFKLEAANSYALTTIHNFSGPDGAYPYAALIVDAAGNLFGTTAGDLGYGGGDDYGTVFKLDASNNYALTTLHAFDGIEGAGPSGSLIADASGNLYGTTWGVYGSNDQGTIYKLDAANAYALTTLHAFDGIEGANPSGSLIADASGNLYGTTWGVYGSNDQGTVYKLDAANAYALTTLHRFNGPDGAYPRAGVIADAAGNLYGTTDGGDFAYGTVFKLEAANNYALTTLHSFSGSPDGAYPSAAVIADPSGNLYGTTSKGGPQYHSGTVFRLDAANSYALTTLHSFGSPDGAYPGAALLADAWGNLYGTTTVGGASGYGTVFKLDAANSYALTILHSFNGEDGASPSAALIADSVGNLFGTTAGGGLYDRGIVFKLDAANNYALTTLHTFDGADGAHPRAALIADSAGNLFGTTAGRYPSDYGTVFKLSASNNYALTTLHRFLGPDGAHPSAAVIADASGNLYGTTFGSYGSGDDYGTAFELSASNNYALTTLHRFGGSDGYHPSGLIADASGDLYGTTYGYDALDGYSSDYGTVFKLSASTNYALTTLHRFLGPDGAHPSAAVIADSSGNLYGTTAGYDDSVIYGPSYPGTIFKLNAANGYAPTTLHSFDAYGTYVSTLIADALGNLYGTTIAGGTFWTGVVYSLVNGVPAPVTGITPGSGPSGGGTGVTITGSGFTAAVSVRFGGAFATGVTVVDPTEVTAVTPPLPPGKLIDVAITIAIGNGPGGPSDPSVLSGAFFSDFLDVPQADIFHADVEKVFRSGITAGCGGGQYCRNSPVSRAQMAVLLLKGEHGAGYVPPICAGIFGDVPCPSQYAAWIEQLSAEGITAGCGSGNYCPGSSVTRAQMAVFLLKSEHGSSYAPPACAGIFGDVLCPSLYADWIEQLSSEGITGGCGGGNYCPAGPVTRGQMAVFLTGTFDLP